MTLFKDGSSPRHVSEKPGILAVWWHEEGLIWIARGARADPRFPRLQVHGITLVRPATVHHLTLGATERQRTS